MKQTQEVFTDIGCKFVAWKYFTVPSTFEESLNYYFDIDTVYL